MYRYRLQLILFSFTIFDTSIQRNVDFWVSSQSDVIFDEWSHK